MRLVVTSNFDWSAFSRSLPLLPFEGRSPSAPALQLVGGLSCAAFPLLFAPRSCACCGGGLDPVPCGGEDGTVLCTGLACWGFLAVHGKTSRYVRVQNGRARIQTVERLLINVRMELL